MFMPSTPNPKPRAPAGSSSAAIVHTSADSATRNTCWQNCSTAKAAAFGATAVSPENSV
jgi:hypothetical protein